MSSEAKAISYSNILRVMAEASVSFNSGYSIRYESPTGEHKKQDVVLAAPFYPAHFIYGGQVIQNINLWSVPRSQLAQHRCEFRGIGLYHEAQGHDDVLLAVPDALHVVREKLKAMFGEPHEVCRGYLNPGGRSFWFFNALGEGYGLKVHSMYELDPTSIVTRPLSYEMIQYSSYISRASQGNPLLAEEEHGCVLNWAQESDQPEEHYGFLLRRLKLESLQLEPQDVLLPIYCLFSEAFWKSESLLAQLKLPEGTDSKRIHEWILRQLPEHFAKMIEASIFESGFHLECHQQNLTVHLRDGKVINLIYHDLQDVVVDPVTRFLNLNATPEDAAECLAATVREHSAWAVFGEISNVRNQHKALFAVHSWWRKWFRILGQYDRTANILWLKDPFAEEKLEVLIRDLIIQKAQRWLKFDLNRVKELGLYQTLAFLHFQYQQQKLADWKDKFIAKSQTQTVSASVLQNILQNDFVVATAQAPRSKAALDKWFESANANLICISASEQFSLYILSQKNEQHLYIHRK